MPPYGRHFPSSFGSLQPSAATVGPFGPNNRALRAYIKMLKIYLNFFLEIHFEKFSKLISKKNFKCIFNIFMWARRALLFGPKGPTVAAEGCRPPKELVISKWPPKLYLFNWSSLTIWGQREGGLVLGLLECWMCTFVVLEILYVNYLTIRHKLKIWKLQM